MTDAALRMHQPARPSPCGGQDGLCARCPCETAVGGGRAEVCARRTAE